MSKRPGESLNGANGKVARLDAAPGIVKKQGRCRGISCCYGVKYKCSEHRNLPKKLHSESYDAYQAACPPSDLPMFFFCLLILNHPSVSYAQVLACL